MRTLPRHSEFCSPAYACQILCAHGTAVVFTLATKEAGGCQPDDPAGSNFVQPTTAKASAALSSAGAVVSDLLLPMRPSLLMKQRGKIVEAKGKVLPDEKLETRWIRHDTSEDDHAQPAAIKSGAGGKTGAQQNSRKSGTARVMPTQDNLYVVDVDEEGIAGAGHWGWMDASVDNTRGRAPPPSLPPLLPTSPGGRVRLSPIEVIHA